MANVCVDVVVYNSPEVRFESLRTLIVTSIERRLSVKEFVQGGDGQFAVNGSVIGLEFSSR